MKNHSHTLCPSCSKEFEIHDNRSFKIEESPIPGGWFYYAMNQFENFNRVTCPFCKNDFIAEEAMLFGIFKSPYLTVISALLLVSILVGVPIFLKFYLNR